MVCRSAASFSIALAPLWSTIQIVGNRQRRHLMGLSLKLDVIVSAVAFLFLTAIIIGMV
jgi:hypothetical protein